MEYAMPLIFATSFLILSVISFYIYKNRTNKNYHRVYIYLILLGIISFIFLILSILWFFNFLTYSHEDFIIIFSFLVLTKTIIFYGFFHPFLKTKKIFLLFLLYLILLVSPLLQIQFSLLIISISFLVMLLFFIKFYSDSHLKDLGKMGIIHSSLSLIFHFIIFVNPSKIIFLFFFSEIFYLSFLVNLLRKIRDEKSFFIRIRTKARQSYLIDFIRYFILIIVLVSVIFVATVSIHELGHIALSKIHGCDYQRIVYEDGLPYTEILCSELEGNISVILGGIIAPLIVSILFFIGGGKFMKEIAILILGFNLVISYKDFIDLGLSNNIAIFASIVGFSFIIMGIGFISKLRTEDV